MPRPKKLNEPLTLSKTMLLFWTQGYAATSMRDVEQVTGLSAGSLYHEFGNKQALFQRSLTFYINTVIQTRIDKYLVDFQPAMEGVRRFLVSAFKQVPQDVAGQSCLLVNTAAEIGQDDDAIGKAVRNGFARLETALAGAFETAKSQGEASRDLDSALAAKHVALLMPGLLIAAKNRAKPGELEQAVDLALTPYYYVSDQYAPD